MTGSRSDFYDSGGEPGMDVCKWTDLLLNGVNELADFRPKAIASFLHSVVSKPPPTFWRNLEHLNIITAEIVKDFYHEGHEEHEEELFGPSVCTWNLGTETRTAGLSGSGRFLAATRYRPRLELT